MDRGRRLRARLKELADLNVPTIEADARFFARHTHRRHRLRLASQAELLTSIECFGGPRPEKGWALYALVKQIEPGVRARGFVIRLAGLDTDISEELCAEFFNMAMGAPHEHR